jgi:hypothetical protein
MKETLGLVQVQIKNPEGMAILRGEVKLASGPHSGIRSLMGFLGFESKGLLM